MAKLLVHPLKSLVDGEISITVQGLLPQQHVTIAAYFEENKMKFASHAHYISDDDGTLDLDKMASVGGSYRDIEPMGLFWAMELLPGQREGLRLMKTDVTTPLCIKLSLFQAHINPYDQKNNKNVDLLSELDIERWYLGDDVNRYEIKEGRLRGALFVPHGTGPFPGILDLYGSGGRVEGRAALLSSKGYTVFHLEYFGEPPLPNSFEIDFEYFDEAFEFMNSQTSVQTNNIGMIGLSWGGEMSLFYASVCPRMKALVAISCSRYVTVAPRRYKGHTFPWIEYNIENIKISENNHWNLGGITFPRKEEARIKLENVPILMLEGSDDLDILPTAAEDIAVTEKHGPTMIKLVTYKDAGHLIEPPYAPFCYMSYHGMIGAYILWGGKQVPHSKAQEHSWKLIQDFFRKHLNREPSSRL